MDEKRRRFEAQPLPHLDAAYNLARWLVRPPLEADDIVQEAILRAFRAFDSLRGEDIKPWLLSIVRNCFLTAAAKSKDRHHVPIPMDEGIGADPAFVAGEPDPESALIEADRARALNAVIASLPQEFRETLILREMEDLSYRDIAEITGVPVGTVMSRLARARALLKARCHFALEAHIHAVQ
jgi:RNA polymerase sigma factor (sigma-70 family)